MKNRSRKIKHQKSSGKNKMLETWGDRLAWVFLAVIGGYAVSYFFSDTVPGAENQIGYTVGVAILVVIALAATSAFIYLSWKKRK